MIFENFGYAQIVFLIMTKVFLRLISQIQIAFTEKVYFPKGYFKAKKIKLLKIPNYKKFGQIGNFLFSIGLLGK